MINNKVQILMSTYNGAKYLDEQIQSILAQERVNFHLLIRDDGSTDQTIEKLNYFSTNFQDKITSLKANNLGVIRSFFDLIERSSDDYDFYAFCDQDDVWDSDKLFHALKLLSHHDLEKPLMYCSPTRMVTDNLKFLHLWPDQPRKPLGIFNALVENVAVGCTIVFNRRAMELIKSHKPESLSNVIMHDWWVYASVSAFGRVIFDKEAHIQYRQHSMNVLGGQTNHWFKKWKKRFLRFTSGQNHYILSKQAKEFLQCFHSILSTEQRGEIQEFLDTLNKSLLHRLFYIIRSPFYRQKFMDHIVYMVVYITGKV